MLTVFLITLAVFGLMMLIMSVGVMFSGRCLRGSCGGPDILDPNGDPLRCATCPKRQQREAADTKTSIHVFPVAQGAEEDPHAAEGQHQNP
jgi:hypothetical protein